jgi:hypothetical protein
MKAGERDGSFEDPEEKKSTYQEPQSFEGSLFQ